VFNVLSYHPCASPIKEAPCILPPALLEAAANFSLNAVIRHDCDVVKITPTHATAKGEDKLEPSPASDSSTDLSDVPAKSSSDSGEPNSQKTAKKKRREHTQTEETRTHGKAERNRLLIKEGELETTDISRGDKDKAAPKKVSNTSKGTLQERVRAERQRLAAEAKVAKSRNDTLQEKAMAEQQGQAVESGAHGDEEETRGLAEETLKTDKGASLTEGMREEDQETQMVNSKGVDYSSLYDAIIGVRSAEASSGSVDESTQADASSSGNRMTEESSSDKIPEPKNGSSRSTGRALLQLEEPGQVDDAPPLSATIEHPEVPDIVSQPEEPGQVNDAPPLSATTVPPMVAAIPSPQIMAATLETSVDTTTERDIRVDNLGPRHMQAYWVSQSTGAEYHKGTIEPGIPWGQSATIGHIFHMYWDDMDGTFVPSKTTWAGKVHVKADQYAYPISCSGQNCNEL